MPELPEVEVIKLGLQKKIIGLKIQKIQVLSPKSFIGNPSLAEGQKVLRIWRKAKILGMDLTPVILSERSESKDLLRMQDSSNKLRDSSLFAQNDKGVTLLFHMKMSGQLVFEDGKRFIGGHPTEDMLGKMPNSHTRVIFYFEDPDSQLYVLPKAKGKESERSSALYFNDQRKFGWVRVVGSGQVTGDSSIKNLGPEPLEKGFTWQTLKENLLRHKSMPIKVAIMDQSVVSGVGNIYANEACFNAKIDPRTKVSEMSDEQFKKLYSGIIKALKDGIKHGGSTRAHFVDPEGHKGYFLDYAFVYWRNSHPCKVCGTEIKKISLGGRGTYFCPKCQKAV